MSGSCEIVVQDGLGTDDALRTRLEAWLGPLVGALAPEARSFGARLAGDAEIRDLNRRLRGKDRATDVLSFPGSESIEGLHLGDVLISVETAREQARGAGHTLERELKELLLHGLLHCLGHDHETDAGEMEAREIELRERWVQDA